MSFWGKKPSGTPDAINRLESEVSAAPKTVASEVTTEAQPTFALKAAEPVKTERAPSGEASYGKVRSALGPGTIIQGRLSFDSVVSIDGKLGGEVFSSKALLIGKTAVVDAKIEAAVVVIRGIVKGTVKATERIEIREGGQLLGDVSTPALLMEEGCVFNGNCLMAPRAASTSAKTPSHETTILATDTPNPEESRAASLH